MINKKVDVLVIGAGLSGLIAAAKAADAGKKVLVAAKGMGALKLSSGCIDIWGYSLEHPGEVCLSPLAEIKKMIARNPGHPYAKVHDVLEESIAYFLSICSANDNPYFAKESGNWVLPTALGSARPTYLAPKSMTVQALHTAKKIVAVGFIGLADFYPEVLLTNLKNNFQLAEDCKLEAVYVDIAEGELKSTALAHLLEKQEIKSKLLLQLKPYSAADSIFLFPPVLGEKRNTKVCENLACALNAPVFEVANIPPALPGQRLFQTLATHLKNKDVDIILGCKITKALVEKNTCTEVIAEGNGKNFKITAKNYILASGSFLGGGLTAQTNLVTETVFKLPVETYNQEWSHEQFLSQEGHAFNKFGILVNEFLQPLDREGNVLIENVMITGALIAGANYPVEKCGNGVALATGYKAGKLAGKVK